MKRRTLIPLLAAVCLLLCMSQALAVSSTVIDLRDDYKGMTQGVLLGKDYLENTHIKNPEDLDADYMPWMQMAVGDYFTEEYFHQYQVYWKCVNAGVISAGDDLDLSLVISLEEAPAGSAKPEKSVVGMESSVISLPQGYAGRTSGVIKTGETARREGLDLNTAYEAWMRMEYGSDFDEAALHEYQVYWKAVDAGLVIEGEDLDLTAVLDTVVYSDGTSKLTPEAQAMRDQRAYAEQEARFQAMRLPTGIVCGILLIVILALSVFLLLRGSNRRHKEFLARGSVADAPKVPEEERFPLRQTVMLNLFGNQVPVELCADRDRTRFMFRYTLDGKEIHAAGEICDGKYVVTDDPSGVGGMVIRDIVSKLTDQWD